MAVKGFWIVDDTGVLIKQFFYAGLRPRVSLVVTKGRQGTRLMAAFAPAIAGSPVVLPDPQALKASPIPRTRGSCLPSVNCFCDDLHVLILRSCQYAGELHGRLHRLWQKFTLFCRARNPLGKHNQPGDGQYFAY